MPGRCARSDRQGDACASPTSRGYLHRRQRRIARDAPTKRRARRGRLVAATPRWLTHPRALQGARDDVRAHAEERAREMASRAPTTPRRKGRTPVRFSFYVTDPLDVFRAVRPLIEFCDSTLSPLHVTRHACATSYWVFYNKHV